MSYFTDAICCPGISGFSLYWVQLTPDEKSQIVQNIENAATLLKSYSGLQIQKKLVSEFGVCSLGALAILLGARIQKREFEDEARYILVDLQDQRVSGWAMLKSHSIPNFMVRLITNWNDKDGMSFQEVADMMIAAAQELVKYSSDPRESRILNPT